jgi:hypothetical protein
MSESSPPAIPFRRQAPVLADLARFAHEVTRD